MTRPFPYVYITIYEQEPQTPKTHSLLFKLLQNPSPSQNATAKLITPKIQLSASSSSSAAAAAAAVMSSQQIASNRENAEVYTGDAICKQKSMELLEKINLPKGLLPLDDIVEVGYNEGTGFVWLKQKKSKTHVFRAIGRSVWYDTEVTAFVQDRRMKRLTGVKSKELLIWVTISDISIHDPNSGKITFGTPAGISRSFPVSAFEEEEAAAAEKVKN